MIELDGWREARFLCVDKVSELLRQRNVLLQFAQIDADIGVWASNDLPKEDHMRVEQVEVVSWQVFFLHVV